MTNNNSFRLAKKRKNDEFYTQLDDVSNELKYYSANLKGKVVYCCCDDYRKSNFVKYFKSNFKALGLKRLISTCYVPSNMTLDGTKPVHAVRMDYDGSKTETRRMKGDGDFRGKESIEILRHVDVAITNPPFSLMRDLITQLTTYKKRFLIIGNLGAMGYKDIFQLFMENKIWFGHNNGAMTFKTLDENGVQKWQKFGNIVWFTNVKSASKTKTKTERKPLVCDKIYNPREFPFYDGTKIINCDKVKNIPDFNSLSTHGNLKMGVPISFLTTSHDTNNFEILGLDRYFSGNPNYGHRFKINGKETYVRIIIRYKQEKNITL